MASKVLITYEADSSSLKAAATEAIKYNDEISESAVIASKEVTAAYQKQAKAATAAFGSQETKKALDDQNAAIDKLQANLKQLYDEEVRLLASGKKLTDEYKRNQQAANEARQRLAELNRVQQGYVSSTEKAVKSNKSLTSQLRALKQELALLESQGKDNTAEFDKLLISAAKLEDQVGDTRERIRVLASDTFKFDAAVDSVRALAGGFTLVQGAIGVFADENEDLQKAIARTNAALAILNGLQEVSAFLSGQSAGKIAIQKLITENFGRSLGVATVGLNLFKAALGGLIVGGVVIVLEAIVDGIKAIGTTSQRTSQVLEASKLAFDSYKQSISDNAIEIARLTGRLTDYEAAVKKIGVEAGQKAAKDITPLILRQRELNKEVTELKERISEGYAFESINPIAARDFQRLKQANIELKTVSSEIQRLQAAIGVQIGQEVKLAGIQEKTNEQNKKSVQITKEKRIEIEALSDAEIKQQQIQLELSDELKKREEEFLRLRVQSRTTELNILQNLNDTAIANGQNTLSRRLESIRLQGEAQKEQAKNSITDEQERATAIQKIDAKTQEAIRAERKRTNDQTIEEIQRYVGEFQSLFTELNAVSRANTETRIASINTLAETELKAINDTTERETVKQRQREALELRTSRKIAAEKTRQAKQDKALAIFNAVIQTAQSIVKTGSNLGYPQAIPFQVAAGIIGAAQVAAIAAQPLPKYEKGGVVGGKRHSQGGTLIEAEVDEFVVKRPQSIKHRRLLADLNDSTEKFKQNIERNYIRPALLEYATGRKRDTTVNVNATLNSKSMEREIKAMRKDLKKRPTVINFNLPDSRYAWQ